MLVQYTPISSLTEDERQRLKAWGQQLYENASGVGSSRVDLQACKLEYSIVSPK